MSVSRGGTCPPMSIAWGQMSSYAIFIGGTCPGGECPTLISTTFSKQAVKALARLCVCAWADPEGDMGSGPPLLKNHITIRFSSNTGMDLLKKSKGYQASIKCWAIIGTTVSPFIN